MDWIQWYYATLLLIRVVTTVWLGVLMPNEKPNLPEEIETYGFKAAILPVNLAVTLPIIGRMFGWW